MLYKINYQTEAKDGWLEGEFNPPTTVNQMGSLVQRLSTICRLYENAYFKLLLPQTQQWLESGAVQMRIIVLGHILQVRFYAESAAIREQLDLYGAAYKLKLMGLARYFEHEDAKLFQFKVFDDETQFRTVDLVNFAAG